MNFDGEDNTIDITFDDFTMKFKVVVRPGNQAIRFDENRFLVLC